MPSNKGLTRKPCPSRKHSLRSIQNRFQNTLRNDWKIEMTFKEHNPRIECKDGFNISVQGSSYNYATPRVDDPADGYTHVECGYPSSKPVTSALLKFAELFGTADYTETVYGYVPVEVVEAELEAHGGVTKGEMPS